jgi:hypothetical protein
MRHQRERPWLGWRECLPLPQKVDSFETVIE